MRPAGGPGSDRPAPRPNRGHRLHAGDNAYPQGRGEDFPNCYEPWWGRHKGRTRPSPGNHDYETPGAAGYFAYFGSSAGPAGDGYYSYSAGDWMVLSLNSNIPVDRGSAQVQWMRGGVARAGNRCTAAYFHHPPFTSADAARALYMRDLWRELNAAGVDLVVAAHDTLVSDSRR